MARKRMIDPSIWDDEGVAKLSFFGRLLYIGMFSQADDYGKGRANANYLRSKIFPYDDVRVAEVDKALSEIGHKTSVQFYEINGQSYYRFKNWERWQKVDKPTKSVIPDPETGDSANNRRGFGEDSANPPRPIRIEKEGNIPPYNPPLAGGEETEGSSSDLEQESVPTRQKENQKVTEDEIAVYFAKTWDQYPRKVSKEQGRKTYVNKLIGLDTEAARAKANEIFLTLQRHMDDWDEEERKEKYIPHFSTWLNENIEDGPGKRRR